MTQLVKSAHSETTSGNPANRLLYSIEEARTLLNVGRSTLYALIAEGRIRPVKLGRRTLIERDELVRFIGSLREAG